MAEAFKMKGEWYLPQSKNIKVSGILEYDPVTGIVLKLDADIYTGETNFLIAWSSPSDANFIHGLSNGQAVTLYKSFQTSLSTSKRSMFDAVWDANYLFLGIWADDESELEFTKLSFEAAYLFDWLGLSGISTDGLPSFDDKIVIRYDTPKPINFLIDSNASGHIGFTYNFKFPGKNSASVNLSHAAYVNIETKESCVLTFIDIRDYIIRFTQWLTIATGKKCRPTAINLYHRDLSQSVHGENKNLFQIEFYSNNLIPISKVKSIDPHQFNFDYSKLAERMPAALTSWFNLYPDLNIVIGILSEAIGKDTIFNENSFKDIVQALESFHRIRRNNEKIPKEEYKEMVKGILESIKDDAYKKFAQERFNFGNEPTLADRLKMLINESGSNSLKILIGNIDDFVKIVKDNRNYFTHYDPKAKKKSLEISDLYILNEKLVAVLFVTILNETLRDKDFVDECLRGSRRWGHRIVQ